MFQTVSRGLILAVLFTFCAGLAEAQQYAALVMDARTGKVVHSRNADTRLHPASLTKMMTLYIVFDAVRRGRLSLDQKVTVSSHAASEPPSKLGLRAGQQIELRYLIRAAAVKSANDAATALGEAVAGSEEAFSRQMNAYARAMGLRNTNFKNAHGLTESGHVSTARDMATLGRRLVYDFPQYYNLFSRNSTSAGIKTVRNTNRRLLDDYPGADGIKTGYTRAAGFNLVSSAQRGNKRVIVAVFGGKSSASRNAEVARLMDLGFGRMPARANVVAMQPIRLASVNGGGGASGGGSTAGLSGSRVAALNMSLRPMPRALSRGGAVARNKESIAAAIAEVNAELAAQASSRANRMATLGGRPAPRPAGPVPAAPGAAPVTAAAASTFASAPAVPAPRVEERAPIAVGSSGTGSTDDGDWGVQLGAYRARGDAERQLLTTALMDVPHLNGGLRRVEAAKVQGVTIYRAQFVGLSRGDAMSACAALARMQAGCVPLAPGT